jgi:hypothetical protein
MSNIVFCPWVGKDYYSSELFSGKKLMVLGESHYGYENYHHKNKCFATINVINEYLNGTSEYDGRIFTALCKICLGKEHLDSEDKHRFFDSIVFYNYLQESLGGPGDRPTSEQWKQSQPAFLEILEQYKPDCLLVLGKALWFQLPDGEGSIKDSPFKYSWIYPLSGGHKVLATFIYHPSRYPAGYGGRNSKMIFCELISTTMN